MVDYEKCFDRVSYNSIFCVFQYFNFGQRFIQQLRILYKNLQLCTLNNGFTSDLFEKQRGLNQRSPESPGVYLLCGEILAHLVQRNSNIKGISIHGLQNILLQFADDMGAFLKYDPLVIEAFCDTLKMTERQLGLKVSYEKTNIYRVRSLFKTNARYYTMYDLNWTDNPVDTLGVQFRCDGQLIPENYETIIEKVRTICHVWQNRSMNLMGKVAVINSLIGSLFVYKMMVLMDMATDQLKRVNKLIHEFLWRGKPRGRIAMKTLCLDKIHGGLRLVSMEAKQKTLKISSIFHSQNDSFLLKCCQDQLDNLIGQLIWRCNIKPKDVNKLFDMKLYWPQVLHA